MQTEFELRVLDIKVDIIISKLIELGAVHVKDRNMKRYSYKIPKGPDVLESWMRLRDDGEKIVLTIKEIHAYTIDGTKETEIIVSNFEQTKNLLLKLGFIPKSYQENKRSSWMLDDVEIEIDSWPKIPSYLEIEGKNRESVEKMVVKLGFSLDQATGLGVKQIYAKYGLDVNSFKELTF